MHERTKLRRSGTILVLQGLIVELLRVHHSRGTPTTTTAQHVRKTLVLVPLSIFTVDFHQQLLFNLLECLDLIKLTQGVLYLVQCFPIISILETA